MKTKLFHVTMLVMALAIGFTACKKEETVKKNTFNYNQKESEIGTAMGLRFGESEIAGVYEISMILFEKTLKIYTKDGYPDSLSGSGDVLLLAFLTDNINDITPGEYSLNTSSAVSKAFTIDTDESGLLVNIVSFESQPAGALELYSGKVIVAKNGDEYEVTLNLKTNVNSTITGYYKGKLDYYSDYKKKSFLQETWFPKPLSERK